MRRAVVLGACLWLPRAFGQGDECEYVRFKSTCRLESLSARTAGGADKVTLVATYAVETPQEGWLSPRDAPKQTEASFPVKRRAAAAMEKHLRDNARVSCEGTYRVTGTCAPYDVRVNVPAFVPADAGAR